MATENLRDRAWTRMTFCGKRPAQAPLAVDPTVSRPPPRAMTRSQPNERQAQFRTLGGVIPLARVILRHGGLKSHA